MKIGVSSYSFRKYIIEEKCDYIKICSLAKEIGFDGIEFINLDSKGFAITEDCVGTAKEIRKYCDEIGLEISAYTVSGNMLAEDIEDMVKYLFDCVDVAEILGAKVMRHDVCFSLPKKYLYGYKEAIADMVPHIRRVTEYAQSKGIKTCLENHGHIFQAPERVEELIKAVNHENYGWLIDMGNFLCVDADPVHAVNIAAPYAFHVHAKDFLYKSGELRKPEGFGSTAGGNYIRGTIAGHGVVPIATCINKLKAAGYDGWLSLEFEGMEECLPAIKAGHDYLRALVK